MLLSKFFYRPYIFLGSIQSSVVPIFLQCTKPIPVIALSHHPYEVTARYTIRYTVRHNTIVSLHSNQFNAVKCSQSIVLFLMLSCRVFKQDQLFTAKSIEVPDSCEETPPTMITTHGFPLVIF